MQVGPSTPPNPMHCCSRVWSSVARHGFGLLGCEAPRREGFHHSIGVRHRQRGRLGLEIMAMTLVSLSPLPNPSASAITLSSPGTAPSPSRYHLNRFQRLSATLDMRPEIMQKVVTLPMFLFFPDKWSRWQVTERLTATPFVCPLRSRLYQGRPLFPMSAQVRQINENAVNLGRAHLVDERQGYAGAVFDSDG